MQEPNEPYCRLDIAYIDRLISMGSTPKGLKFLVKVREYVVAGDFESVEKLFADPLGRGRSKPDGFGKVSLGKSKG